MKVLRSVAALALFIVIPSSAQQVPTAIMVDQFSDASCEVLWARLDNFHNELSNNPTAVATIAVSGKIGELHDDLWIEDMIRGYFLRTRTIPSARWKIVRMRPEVNRKIEFWITPLGAEPPKIETAEWSLIYPEETKPFIFAYDPDHMEEVSVCLASNQLRFLAQVLRANPTARINVVLVVRSQKEFARRTRQTIAELVRDYGVQLKQIRVFKKITRKADPYNIEPDVEYWFVP
jgi:hypothetical protein